MNKWAVIAAVGTAAAACAANTAFTYFLSKGYEGIGKRLYNWLHKAPKVDDWMDRLNEAMDGKVVFHSEIRSEPEIREVPTGFIQLIRIGYNIDPGRKNRLKATWEGQVQYIKFDHLLREMQHDKWVPTGLGHILAWLALGTPGLKSPPRFKRMKSNKLFEAILKTYIPHFSDLISRDLTGFS
jgi:hypothetical protein